MSDDRLLHEIGEFIGGQTLAVVATLGPDGAPQAALVGIAVSEQFELVFDSVDTSRKICNVRRDPRVAVVVGGSLDDERTVQIDGVADEPDGEEGSRIRETYFRRWPDGRDRLHWTGITHVRITPAWLRFSDWSVSPVTITEWVRREGGELRRG